MGPCSRPATPRRFDFGNVNFCCGERWPTPSCCLLHSCLLAAQSIFRTSGVTLNCVVPLIVPECQLVGIVDGRLQDMNRCVTVDRAEMFHSFCIASREGERV